MIGAKIKTIFGINSCNQNMDDIMESLYQDFVSRNFFFHLFIIGFELFMALSISIRPGGPFAKPRRVAYFLMYLIMIFATLWVTAAQAGLDGKKENRCRLYFRLEHAYIIFFGFWGIAVTLNDQLGGNGLTVYNYVMLIMAIMSLMKPWKTALLFLMDFILLNLLLPYAPDPSGLNQSFNNLMNSLFLTLASITIATTLYNSRMQAKENEIIIKRQYRQIESANMVLQKEALLDALTGLQNRNSFKKAVRRFSETGGSNVACIYMDVNGLHEVNNHLGHQAGDVMLKTIAHVLLEYFGPEEVFRIGGDEFVVLCANISQPDVIQKTDSICRQTADGGYSLSVGVEWRESDPDIAEIVQKAEEKMQKHKKEYYSSPDALRQRRELDIGMERIISEKKNMDRFLSVLVTAFKGVYYVDLKDDTLRHVFIPPYFQEMLEETDHQYSKALMLYARRMVHPRYVPLFERFCDYDNLETLLDGEDIPGFVYERKDGVHLRLRVLKYNHYSNEYKETLWIFSDIEVKKNG